MVNLLKCLQFWALDWLDRCFCCCWGGGGGGGGGGWGAKREGRPSQKNYKKQAVFRFTKNVQPEC
jgi:hypothetical protein